MSPKWLLKGLEFCLHFSPLLCVLPTFAAYRIAPHLITLIIRTQNKKFEVLRSPKILLSKHPQSTRIWHLMTWVYSDGIKRSSSRTWVHGMKINRITALDLFRSLRWVTTCDTHPQEVTFCCVLGQYGMQIGTGKTKDSELHGRSLLYVWEFQWSSLARTQGTAAKLCL